MTRQMSDVINRFSARLAGGQVRDARPLDRVPRVSVVIPCYNYGHYLRQCVESVTHRQPGIEVEVIIVDDRSTDDSLSVAQSIQDRDERVRVIRHEQNKGHIATYNDGLEAATGEFVLLLSADDLATPGALTRAAELLAAEPSVGMVYGNAIHFSGSPPASREEGRGWIIWRGVDWLASRCRSGYNVVASPEVVMRTSVLRAFGGYRADLPHAGDFEMWLRTSAVSDVGFLMGVDQAYYRHHTVNMNRKDFRSGTARGHLIDLEQRWRCFEAVFSGVGAELKEASGLLETARQTMARQALNHISHAYARGLRDDFPAGEFEALAYAIDRNANSTGAGRALARQRRLETFLLPFHPLAVVPVFSGRIGETVRRWRRRRIGI